MDDPIPLVEDARRVGPGDLVTAWPPLDSAPDAYGMSQNTRQGSVKVVFDPMRAITVST